VRGPNLTPDEIESMGLQESWSHAEQREWAAANLTQQEINRLVIDGVDAFVARCEAANQGERDAA